MSIKIQIEAAIAEIVSELGDAEQKSALGRFFASHKGVIATAALSALMTPSPEMLSAMEPWTQVSGHQSMVWKAGVKSAMDS